LVEAGFWEAGPAVEKDFTYRKTNFIMVDGLYTQELQSDESGVDEQTTRWGDTVKTRESPAMAKPGHRGANVGGGTMAEPKTEVPVHLRDRVDKMLRRDSRAAIALVTVLWLTIFFVILAVRPYMPPGVEPVCWIAAAFLLLYNTASIVAMLRHYSEDKAHIYPIDIHHLDAGH
jgi:hypothetical protein